MRFVTQLLILFILQSVIGFNINDLFNFRGTQISTIESPDTGDIIIDSFEIGPDLTNTIDALKDDALELFDNKTGELRQEADELLNDFFGNVTTYINTVANGIMISVFIVIILLIAVQIGSIYVLYKMLSKRVL